MRTAMKISVLALMMISVLAAVSSANGTGTVTGGGFIASAGNPAIKATFGINTTNGTLTYVDHDMTIVNAVVTGVSVTGNSATITGTARVKTIPGTTQNNVPFVVDVVDNGTPGSKGDTFAITVGAYSNSGALKGGNIVVTP